MEHVNLDLQRIARRYILMVASALGLALGVSISASERAMATPSASAPGSTATVPMTPCKCTPTTQLRPQSCQCNLTVSFSSVFEGTCDAGACGSCCVPSSTVFCTADYSISNIPNAFCSAVTTINGSLLAGCNSFSFLPIPCSTWGGSGQAQVALICDNCQ